MPHDDYTRVSSLAVVSLATGVFCMFGFLLLPMSIIGSVALITGILALFGIRKYGFKGRHLAVAGIALSLIGMSIPPSWVYYSYLQETLPGHTRVDLENLIDSQPSRLDRYVGKPICVTGFALFEREYELTQFKFSPDGNWKKTERSITVELPERWTWQETKIVVSGTLVKIDHPFRDQPEYLLKATAVRPASNRSGLVELLPAGDC